MNNKKGFTLVELLAVIVVLAIIMLIGVNSVLPLIENSRKGAFASSANIVLSTVQSNVLEDEMYENSYDCYDLAYLIDKGLISKIDKYDATNKPKGFMGYVYVDRSLGKIYQYRITLYDYGNKYLVNNVLGTINTSNIESKVNDPPSLNCIGEGYTNYAK